MDFLGIGVPELLFIIVIALIVIGPKQLSGTAKTAGRWLNKLYRSEAWRTMTQASRDLRNLPTKLAREAHLEELDEIKQSIGDLGRESSNELRSVEDDLRAWSKSASADLHAAQESGASATAENSPNGEAAGSSEPAAEPQPGER